MTCGECKHFDSVGTRGYGECRCPLPKSLNVAAATELMHETNEYPCAAFERKEEK